MIDFSSTVVELSGYSEKQKEVQDIAKCLRTLYSTPIGSQEGDRELGINPNIFVDKPLPVAKGLYVAEVTEKTASFEPRARVVRVDWRGRGTERLSQGMAISRFLPRRLCRFHLALPHYGQCRTRSGPRCHAP